MNAAIGCVEARGYMVSVTVFVCCEAWFQTTIGMTEEAFGEVLSFVEHVKIPAENKKRDVFAAAEFSEIMGKMVRRISGIYTESTDTWGSTIDVLGIESSKFVFGDILVDDHRTVNLTSSSTAAIRYVEAENNMIGGTRYVEITDTQRSRF